LKHIDEPTRRTSIVILARIGGDAMPGLIGALAMEDPRVHNSALVALSQIGLPAVPSLMKTLGSHRNGWVRYRAAMALGQV
jgi:HEAT repeat protein